MTIPATQLPSIHDRQAVLHVMIARFFKEDRSDWRDECKTYTARQLEQCAKDLRELDELEKALSGQVDSAQS